MNIQYIKVIHHYMDSSGHNEIFTPPTTKQMKRDLFYQVNNNNDGLKYTKHYYHIKLRVYNE